MCFKMFASPDADGTVTLVIGPPRACDEAAYDRFHRQHLQLVHEHRPALNHRRVLRARLGHRRNVGGYEMVLNTVGLQVPQPELRDLVQNLALARDSILHDHVKSRDAVGDDDEQALFDAIIVDDESSPRASPRTSPMPSPRLPPPTQSTTPHLASSGFNFDALPAPGEGKPVTGEVGPPPVPTPGKYAVAHASVDKSPFDDSLADPGEAV